MCLVGGERTRQKVLWHSNAPWVGTGYGSQTALFVPQIADLGYDVAVSAFYGLQGAVQEWNCPDGRAFRIYPGGQNPWGNDVFGAHFAHWCSKEKGLLFVLTDPWVLVPELTKRVPCVAWTPVDHEPVIPQTKEWFANSGAIALAMSRWGQRALEEAGVEAPLYTPHGYDPDIFYPRERDVARKASQLPKDAYLVGMIAANKGAPSRKGFTQALTAFAAFQQRHGDAILYLHTATRVGDGENLTKMAESLGIKPYIPQQYLYATGLPASHVANLASGFDVLLNPSHGEGFGLAIIEAAACGTPAIVTDFSAMPEVAGPTAWRVSGQPTWSGFQSWQVCPDIEEIVEALEEGYSEAETDRLRRREETRAHAEPFAAPIVARDFLGPALEEACARLDWAEHSNSIKELVV